jgi:hypothetical protein
MMTFWTEGVLEYTSASQRFPLYKSFEDGVNGELHWDWVLFMVENRFINIMILKRCTGCLRARV